jgi:regulator of sigma E protease
MHILLVILEFIVVLGIMVLVHELGHFIVGKLCGVRVEVFSIGFPPTLFNFRHGETDYRISAIPLGGYVKFAGEYTNEAGPPQPGDLGAQPRWQRILIALAGPVSNFILAFFLLTLAGIYHYETDQYLNGPAVVDYVPANTPAAHDGIAAGDTILSLNGVNHPTWDQILEESALNLNRDLPITFRHNGQPVSRSIDVATTDDSDFTADDMTSIGLIPRMQPGPIGVASISGGTPAARAGLQPGDELEQIDGLQMHSVLALHSFLKDKGGAPATLLILRHGHPLSVGLTPERIDTDPKDIQYQIGFMAKPSPVNVTQLPLGAAVDESIKQNRHNSKLILRVIKGLFTRHVSVRQMSGPIGIAQDIGIATQMGIWPLISLMSLISLNLGIFNLLPFPPLDGGMIFFLLIESIMRRDVNQQVKDRIYQVAFVCVIAFFFFVIFNDITKLHLGH